jgi:hypothetical protein
MRIKAVELLSNLTWAIAAATLWAFWLAHQNGGRGRLRRSGIAVQMIGLVMLSAILLPAISVTDDLHASDLPAEVERVCSWSHRQSTPQQPSQILPLALALIVLCPRPSRVHTIAFLTADKLAPRRQTDYQHLLWPRPPPAA